MSDPKIVSISIGVDYVSFDIEVRDKELIDIFLNGLSEYVASGHQIKIMQSNEGAQSQSKKIINKILSNASQADEWKDEAKQIFSVMRQRGRM